MENEKLKMITSALKLKKELLDGAEKGLSMYPQYSPKRDQGEKRVEALRSEIAKLEKEFDAEVGQTVMFGGEQS